MRVICSGRKTSRTTQLIEMCAEAEARGEVSYIVCHSQQAASHIFQRAQEMGLIIGFPITFEEFRGANYAYNNIKNFYMDNADYFLQSLTPVKISAVVFEKREDEDADIRSRLS
jgi:hypothetical protein